MKNYCNKRAKTLLAIILLLFALPYKLSADGKETPERTLLFDMGDDGSRFYRIPALITAADGSLVAIADKRWDAINDLPSHIDVISRRSEDNGRTWSKAVTIAGEGITTGYGDPAVVLDRKTGNLICIFASGNGLWQSNASNPMRINISKSMDNGRTWTKPIEITSQIYGKGCPNPQTKNWYGAFTASGRALQLRDGRIMFVIAARETSDWGGALSNYACYSDDGGDTWSVSKNAADTYGDEAKVVELNNGDILMSIRNRNKGFRKFCISKTKGMTWEKSYLQEDIREPACNGDIIRYTSTLDGFDKNRIIHSIPDDSHVRQNVSVLLSYDEGQTWAVKKTLCAGLSAYSSMTILADGTIGAIVEEGKWDDNPPEKDGFRLWFIRFTLDWLTDGRDSYEKPMDIPTIKANKHSSLSCHFTPEKTAIMCQGDFEESSFLTVTGFNGSVLNRITFKSDCNEVTLPIENGEEKLYLISLWKNNLCKTTCKLIR